MRLSALLGIALVWPTAVLAGDADAFRSGAGGVLARHCVGCHRGAAAKASLDLATAAGLRRGGDSGPVVAVGDPEESLLITNVSGEDPQMPKDGRPLAVEEIEILRAWVREGAAWPEGLVLEPSATAEGPWWSLEPLARPMLPEADPAWVRTPIDAFIGAKLQERGLAPSPEADRRTLLRRLYYDIIGLPPSPEEVTAFQSDKRPDAYERLVDQLLASPRYGERWARHWLDTVHYGDTHGYDKDKVRPNAWPYRDYVIRAFNSDKPYAEFVREQLAGDVLYPDSRDGIVATGFIAAGPFDFVGQIEVGEDLVDKQITRNLDRDDMVATAINTFVSATAQCARCHNHKFDPITQEDYYSLQAVFAGLDRAERPFPADPELDSRAEPVVYAAATHFKAEGNFRPTEGRPRRIYLLGRGSERSPLAEVGPGALSCVQDLKARFALAEPHNEGARRAALAEWIVDSRNPLTWRSIVNRVWQYHFGRGIVDTPNDFGRMGSLPTHPELLDWLAIEFRDSGGSLKALHRLIVTSAVYRQSSAHNAAAAAVDAGNQYLWRMNRRRLEAEAIYDSALTVAGKLDLTMYGPGYQTFAFRDDHSPEYKYQEHDPNDPRCHRRSIYRFIVRSVPDPFMERLDCADPSLLVEKRTETLTPVQVLAQLNNRFMLRMAEHFAARVAEEEADMPNQVALAFRLAIARDPSDEELRLLTDYAREHGLPNACRAILNLNEFVFVD